jgi:hypothetical protein
MLTGIIIPPRTNKTIFFSIQVKSIVLFCAYNCVQTKKSKDTSVGYAFVRFKDKEVERKVLKVSVK